MAAFFAHASASSRSAASSIQNPPMCSLVSVYGPSVTSTLPSGCFRSVFALAAGEMPQANFLAPAAINSRLSAWISSIILSVTVDGSKSSELRKSRERFELAVEGSQDGLYDFDLEAGKIHISPRAWALLGYSEHYRPSGFESWRERVLVVHDLPDDLVHPEDE